MEKEQMILEEIKLIQPIIARQDEFQFKIKALAMTIFSGLTIALFTLKAKPFLGLLLLSYGLSKHVS